MARRNENAALVMLERLGAGKAYNTKDFVAACRNMEVTPHVAENTKRSGGSATEERTTRHAGYAVKRTGSAR